MSIRKQVDAARVRKDKAIDAIYACAESGNVPFNDCLALAGEATRGRYDAAVSRLIDLECQAVWNGKAWRGAFGMLVWNR
jgi:hypothetical protein